MKALIAVDGSRHSMEAVAQIGMLLSAERDHAILYYSPTEFFTIENAAGNTDVLQRARSALVTAVFAEASSHLPEVMRGRTETIVGTQSAAHGILVAAKTCSADLVAVGARGLGPLQQLLLGSVSRSVVHQAELPVFVARPRQKSEHTHLRALLACSGAKECNWLSGLVNKLTWPTNSVARTISVLPSVLGDNDVPEWLEEQARQTRSEALAKVWAEKHEREIVAKREEMTACLKTLPEAFHNSTPLVFEGHPAKRILEAAARERANLIVMGTHVHGLIARFLVGSTCEAVLSHAPCSLLVLPATEIP
jgi:nucleotide-binding universal stress UspA family protein